MFSRLSSNILLKSVIALMAAVIVAVLATGAWDAWRIHATASHLADVADVSRDMFRAMANIRLIRSRAVRAVSIDGMATPDDLKQLEESRTIGIASLQSALLLLPSIQFAQREVAVKNISQLTTKLRELDQDIARDVTRPKGERRGTLAKEIQATTDALMELITQINASLDLVSRNRDAFIDQMMMIKDAGWMIRSDFGDISVAISNALAFKQHLPPVALQKLAGSVARAEAGWDLLDRIRFGLTPQSPATQAIERAKAAYFESSFTANRNRIMAALGSSDQIAIPSSDWRLDSVPRLDLVAVIPEAALDAARDHAQAQVTSARTNLIVRLVLLAAALVLAAGGILIVSRRVIGPLQVIRAAMVKVADGDLSTEVPYRDRTDEIGSLAAALATFKQNAVEKARIEQEQEQRRAQATHRQQAIERHIAAFEAGIGDALQALGSAATGMRQTSDTLSATADRTNGQARDAASSSTEASQNVETVAAASEELSSSIHEISRQVSHAATVAKRAVAETQETDATVQGLTDAAHKIGEIVNLITAIASQTNLLALNATIEAARAGEAGKGFAVVASEVKTLAGQTAKATEDISGQVGAIQTVADQALAAMRRIGSTITEVSAVASSIAAAVEEQGAATAEITRNTQEAARRTRDVSENIGGVRAGADATGAAADGVKSSAEILNLQADKLRSEVDTFLHNIRAA
ncbi:MAG: methyl-accepting chemotaxis protein [Rhodoplanes sp.]|uniref:methyl-accepting chemotaxis protein n=1 Tax=Rhodoplanes sp. TaxID=1968906 RepID=UPI0017CA3E92|nr:HAMP domain-containing methyl-accepting chemotaxis protein [Rhodoplanes sp.]NVO15462.1 methyl-accepting chemotaxis protein [Rhodoplanes sp.]